MSVIILLNQSSATLRVVPLPPLVQSNGTSACTNESGRTFYFSVGGVDYGSGGSISAISSAMGLYECLFSASKVSVAGQGRVYYGGVNSSATAMVASTPIEVVRYDSYDSMRFGQFALPNAAAEAAGGIVTFGTGAGQLHTSSGSVGLKAQTHSQATITGINNILAGTYSGVTFEVSNIKPGSYSGVTVGIDNIKGATYSDVTIQGLSRINSSVTLNANTHSGATIQGISNWANISNVTLAAGIHSGATVAINDIAPKAYSGVTVDGAKFLLPAGERSLSSSLLSTNMGSNRVLQEFFWSMRNKITVSGLTMTVFLPDDSTSAYTASVTTGLNAVLTVDGGGRP